MINFKKKLYIVTGLLTLSAGQFFAVASDDESEEFKKDSYAMPQQTPEATQNTLVDNTTDFLPKILGRDTQNCLATYMLEIEDPLYFSAAIQTLVCIPYGRSACTKRER